MATATHNRDEREDEDDQDLNNSADMSNGGGSPLRGKEQQMNGTGHGVNGSSVPPAKTDRYGFLGGNQYTNPEDEKRLPQEKLRKREIKWMDMFENWDKWMSKKFRKVRDRCRKGIPASMRARAWQYLCGTYHIITAEATQQQEGIFQGYLKQDGDPKCIDDIQKDLDRQFPLHEMFLSKGGVGQEALFEVLKAYSIHRPADGYCQAQAPIAALLLMHMPAMQAFWCLVAICDKYLNGYYSPGLEAVQLDGDILFGLLKRTSPSVHKHMRKQHIEPIMYMTEWFMCCYTRTLSWTIVLRLWDQFLCEGVKVMFRVGLVLLRVTLQDHLDECPSFYETLEKLRLRNLPQELMDESYLFTETLRLSITERDMAREHQKQTLRRKAAREALEKEKAAGAQGSSSKQGKNKKRS